MKRKPKVVQQVKVLNKTADGSPRWFPDLCTVDNLFPAGARMMIDAYQHNTRHFINSILFRLDTESCRRMYTGSITGGSTRRINLIIKNLNYWIIQMYDFGPVRESFTWTKGMLKKDKNGFLSVCHKYMANNGRMRIGRRCNGPTALRAKGVFFICLGARLENVPCYGGRLKTWLVNKFPSLKKKFKYTTYPRVVVHMSIHVDRGIAYVFDIASVDVGSEQTVNAQNKEQKVQNESIQTRSDFRSEGPLRLSEVS